MMLLRQVSLRKLEARQRQKGGLLVHRSQLSRYEHGAALPDLDLADHLDDLYEANGWIAMGLRNLYRSTWDPWGDSSQRATRIHAAKWPARYEGAVWIEVRAEHQAVGFVHSLTFRWGPWSLSQSLRIAHEGTVFLTGKARDDGEAVTMNIDSDRPTYLLYGTGEPEPPGPFVDLRGVWEG